MSYLDKLKEIELLQSKIKAHGPIQVNLLNKINYKLRLEWNYTSNSMEGNSLTKRETRTVMVDAIDVNGKPLKDIQEMKNHDKVITTIMKMGKGELNISESRIKEIHKGIMYEEDTEKQQYIGNWKNVDNYMYNNQGERYDFVKHTEVPQRMHELVNWINHEKEKIQRSEKDASHPLSLALKFHLDYLDIHPFYDGNGRTARILSNLILISYGYPPLYIKENEKQNYYKYLTDIQSYGGDESLFYDFMSSLLLRSLNITIDTLEGKEIEEDDDFIKEIQLLKIQAKEKGKPRSPKIIYDTFEIIDKDLWRSIKSTLRYFETLFNETRTIRSFNHKDEKFDKTNLLDAIKVIQSNEPTRLKIFGHDLYENDTQSISIEHRMVALNGANVPSDLIVLLQITFLPYKYHINIKSTGQIDQPSLKSIYTIEKKYLESFLPEELADINSTVKKHLLDEIKSRIDNSEKKA